MSTFNQRSSREYFQHPTREFWIVLILLAMLLLLLLMYAVGVPRGPLYAQATAQQVSQDQRKTNDVVIELFYRSDSKSSLNSVKYLEELTNRRLGLKIKTYDVLADRKQLKRLWGLAKEFGHEKPTVPTFYLCHSLKIGFDKPETSGVQIEQLLNIKAYIRPGCKHCQQGKSFLDELVKRWPAFSVEYFNVETDINNRNAVQSLFARYNVSVPSFPAIAVANRLFVGFQSNEITGTQIEQLFKDRSVAVTENAPRTAIGSTAQSKRDSEPTQSTQPRKMLTNDHLPLLPHLSSKSWSFPPQDQEEDMLLPGEAEDLPVTTDSTTESDNDEIEVPVFGRLSVSKLGLPLFTFLIGLVDGFNPCAMWVLIFLLSVLVSIKDRRKILIVAGTFIVVSGLAYFVFMAAWFSVFQMVGYMRPVQIGLGIVAIVIGLINVKDFFAFHKGITLSIPDSAKPGIYRRVREIVSANHLTAALSGAVVLAVVVNIVELLCTAGLPAMYSQILTMQELPTWANYSYLALYISAYMLDDAILVGIVVATLSNRRLQEKEGRWLKLFSGLVILLLGIVMIFWPDMLI